MIDGARHGRLVDASQEDAEVIRMSQWAEIRHLHLVERVPKKEIARRLKVDVKTVRRAIRPVDAAGAGVAATARQPGPVAGPDQAVAARGAAVDRETDSSVVAADGGTAPGADGALVRRGAEDGHHEEGGLRAPQRAAQARPMLTPALC